MEKKSRIYHMTVCALMAAVLCVVGPLTLPIGPIPVSLANFVICLTACLLGWKWGSVSVIVYVAIGACGVPVFSGYSGGLAKIAGPTGGYIVGYVFITLVGGLFIHLFHGKYSMTMVGLILGMAVLYLFGTVWYCLQASVSFAAALAVCVYPFVLIDLIKIVAATLLGATIRKRLTAAGLI